MVLRINANHSENAGVLGYLGQGLNVADLQAGPTPDGADRWHLGTHPDLVDHLWDVLNAALPVDGRCLMYGGPALANAASGIVLAVGLGTEYALRLLPADRLLAIEAGAEVIHTFKTSGGTLDLPVSFGPDWAFGSYDRREPEWLAAVSAGYG